MGYYFSKTYSKYNSDLGTFDSKNIRETIPERIPSQKNIATMSDFKVTLHDMIGERKGEITKYYSLLNPPIGKGSYGEVRRAIHKQTNITRAVKIIIKENTDPEEIKRLMNEVEILRNLDHPHILKVIEYFQDEKYFYIVTEYLNGGELFDKITEMYNLEEKLAGRYIKQILSALSFCHKHNIVHRDLKPENVIFESKKADSPLKVIDFGVSRYYKPDVKMHSKFGTVKSKPYYIAPEVLKKQYTEKCDIWSIGVMLYVMLSGYPPFSGANHKEIFEKVKKGKFDFNNDIWDTVSEDGKELITLMLQLDPEKRISADQALSHQWIKYFAGDMNIEEPVAINTLRNMKSFKIDKKFQEAVWLFLINNMVSREEKNIIMKLFEALDSNGDGNISRQELEEGRGYKSILKDPNAEKIVENIMASIDYNDSGNIEFTEFLAATVDREKMLSDANLESVFSILDKDGSGYITADELESVFNQSEKRVESHIWRELLKEADENDDDQISLQEFKNIMKLLLNNQNLKEDN